jgi:hypothetical protein
MVGKREGGERDYPLKKWTSRNRPYRRVVGKMAHWQTGPARLSLSQKVDQIQGPTQLQTFLDTGVDVGVENASVLLGTAIGEFVDPFGGGLVGAVGCSFVGAVAATEFEDQVLNPRLKRMLLGQPF